MLAYTTIHVHNELNTNLRHMNDNNMLISINTNLPLRHHQSRVDQLNAVINPIQDCNDFGKQLYLDTVQQLFTLMSNDGLIDWLVSLIRAFR